MDKWCRDKYQNVIRLFKAKLTDLNIEFLADRKRIIKLEGVYQGPDLFDVKLTINKPVKQG